MLTHTGVSKPCRSDRVAGLTIFSSSGLWVLAGLICGSAGCVSLAATDPSRAPTQALTSAQPTAPESIAKPATPASTLPSAVAARPANSAKPAEPNSAWRAWTERLQPKRCGQSRPKHWINQYASHPERFQARLTAYAPILQYVARQTSRRNLPAEIALVPIVESAYQGHPGRGRSPAGMWQMIPSTARSVGLTVQAGRDDRLDSVLATRAALSLFERLLRRFDEDLPLALAAYNAGDNRVARALARSGKSSARELPLSSITINYLDRIAALSCLMADPESYGFAMPPLPPPARLHAVELPFAADAERIASALRLDSQSFRRYNGAIRGPRARHAGHHWLVPAAAADALLALEPAQIAADPAMAQSPAIKTPASHVVVSGDNLWSLARRYGVSVRELRRWNRLSANTTLQVGQRLRLAP